MIKYLGSKRILLPRITAAVAALGDVRTVFDVFSGTARVGHALKRTGLYVIANDHLAYAATLATCYIAGDKRELEGPARRILRELATLPGKRGYFTETFCERSRFFQPKNGERVDAIREALVGMDLEPTLEAVILTSLMEAADRVDSTTGLQMAYLKTWAPRASNNLELRVPILFPGRGVALQLDAIEAACQVEADVAYLDPPYNQHRYMGNYHIWESLVRWDKPEVYGTACKRVDCREYDTPFNSRKRIHEALAHLISALRVKHLVVSFSNEGYVTKEEMLALLQERGFVAVAEVHFKRYVGAQIGIYNPSGERVGKVSHLRNTEYLFIVSDTKTVAERAAMASSVKYQAQMVLL